MTKAKAQRIFLDTNILLDAILNRENAGNALLLLDLCHMGTVHGFVAPVTYTNIAYILRKRDKEDIHATLTRISRYITTLPMNESQFESAMKYGPVDDFEDMMQFQCAKEGKCDVIITNNVKDFLPFSIIPVKNGREFLTQMLDDSTE